MAIQLSFDILDSIFLVLDRKTLIACSKDSLLSPIVERHVYYHIIVQIGTSIRTVSDDALAFGPAHLSKLILDNPRIPCYVRILQIEILRENTPNSFANTLLAFPALECIMLNIRDCTLPDVVLAALEDRLGLQTVEEVHLTGNAIHLSLLEHSKYIKSLLLSAFCLQTRPYPLCSSTLPQPHSLRLLNDFMSASLLSWVKLHSREIRSFRTKLFGWEDSSEILGVCSGTLVKLDIDATYFRDDFLEFPVVLPNLEQLTIRTRADRVSAHRASRPQAVAKLVHLFRSTLRHLSIDINVVHRDFTTSLIDFSPFAFLGTVSRSIPRIDLYVHTKFLPSQAIDHAQVLSSLEVYEDIARSIKEGGFVIHSEKTAPDFV